jgi:hypothetical protein
MPSASPMDSTGMEEGSTTDPGSRGVLRTDGGASTPKGFKTRGKSSSAIDRQSGQASDTAYNERREADLAVERDDISL